MKIYHKNSLYASLPFFGGALLIASQAQLEGLGWNGSRIFQVIVYSLAGLCCLHNAMSKKAAKDLIIRDSDEILQLKKMKRAYAAFWTTFWVMLLIGLVSSHFSDTDFGLAMTLCSLLVVVIMSVICIFVSCVQYLHEN